MLGVAVTEGDPRGPEARRLLEASHALMESLFPSEANHYLPIEALCTPDIYFYVAKHGQAVVGCVALAEREGYGEIKSMFVDPNTRGAGVGAALLDHVISEGRALGLTCLRLETGTTLDAAHRLYRRHGFMDRGAFGDYAADAPYSLYMERVL